MCIYNVVCTYFSKSVSMYPWMHRCMCLRGDWKSMCVWPWEQIVSYRYMKTLCLNKVCLWLVFQCRLLAGMQSHRALLSALNTKSSVLESRLKAVFFRSCKALCINSKAWQSTHGRLSAGMTLPDSSAYVGLKQTSWSSTTSITVATAARGLILSSSITTIPVVSDKI